MSEENRLYEKIGGLVADIGSMKESLNRIVEQTSTLNDMQKDVHSLLKWKEKEAEPVLEDYNKNKQRALGIAGLLVLFGTILSSFVEKAAAAIVSKL